VGTQAAFGTIFLPNFVLTQESITHIEIPAVTVVIGISGGNL
jgi:hypothetical protein